MAILKCLAHAPTERHRQDYVRPSHDLSCSITGCTHPAVIWLNPEEVKDYERGSRVFWESSSFALMRAGDAGPRRRPWDGLGVISALFGRMGLALRRYLEGWRQPVPVSSQGGDLPPPLQGVGESV